MKKIIYYLFKKRDVRRYNFIVGDILLYSGLFNKHGFFGDAVLSWNLSEKRKELSSKYSYPVKTISISNTIKD